MRERTLIIFFMIIFLPACTQYRTYDQSTGFMAPKEHAVPDPLLFCKLEIAISDPKYSTQDKVLVSPVLQKQIIKYINADGRLKVLNFQGSTKQCTENYLFVDFSNMTDHWDKERNTQLYTVQANTKIQYNQQPHTFYIEEESGQKEFQAYTNLDRGNSVRNRTRFMDKWVTQVDALVRGIR